MRMDPDGRRTAVWGVPWRGRRVAFPGRREAWRGAAGSCCLSATRTRSATASPGR